MIVSILVIFHFGHLPSSPMNHPVGLELSCIPNTPGTPGGPGGRDRTLAVEKNLLNDFKKGRQPNGRQQKWKMTKMEDDQNRRRSKWKTILNLL